MHMEYFVRVPDSVFICLEQKGADPRSLQFSVKADLDKDNCYYDVYLFVDAAHLHLISGRQTVVKKDGAPGISGKKNRYDFFDCDDYRCITLDEIESLTIERQLNTARFVAAYTDGRREILCQFSIGFTETFSKFSECVFKIKNGEEINRETLSELQFYCPKCGYRYPEKERKVCPNCTDKMSIFKRLLKMYTRYKISAIIIFVSLILMAGFAVISPMFSEKMLYDDVLRIGGKYYGQVLFVVLLILIVRLLEMLMNMIYSVIISKITPEITHDLRMSIFSALQNLSLNFFTSKQTGSLMSRILNDSEDIYSFFVDVIPMAIVNFIKIVGLASIMVWLNPYLTLLIVVGISLTAFLAQRFNRKRRKLHRKRHRAVRSTYSVVSDTLNGQRVVKSFAREQGEIERYGVFNQQMHDISYKISYEIQRTMPTLSTITRIAGVLMIALGGWLIIEGHFTIGALTALISYSNMLDDPINFFMRIGDRWARCVDASSRMFEILDSLPSVREAAEPIRLPDARGEIEFRSVCFEYEAARPILTDLSFHVPAGRMLGIVGRTGAGKTTIINLIARMYDAKSGEVLIDGVNIKNISFADLHKNIGIVSQETYLFMGSVADNIRYSNPNAPFEDVVQAAKAAYAHDFIMKLPDGYDTKIGVGGHDFSGGERQRISIARALLQKPNILILDEATASMDTRTERNIQAAIDRLKEGRTIIAIAHRLSTLRDADQLLVVENGRIVERGTHDELIHRKGVYFDLHRLQSQALQFIENNG